MEFVIKMMKSLHMNLIMNLDLNYFHLKNLILSSLNRILRYFHYLSADVAVVPFDLVGCSTAVAVAVAVAAAVAAAVVLQKNTILFP